MLPYDDSPFTPYCFAVAPNVNAQCPARGLLDGGVVKNATSETSAERPKLCLKVFEVWHCDCNVVHQAIEMSCRSIHASTVADVRPAAAWLQLLPCSRHAFVARAAGSSTVIGRSLLAYL
jgi:hypothetical protein